MAVLPSRCGARRAVYNSMGHSRGRAWVESRRCAHAPAYGAGERNSMEQSEQEKLRQEVDEVLHGQKQPQGPEKFPQNDYSNVRHVIGVVSGKGGVGKSLVCGTLAVELARRGAKAGILDADVTGPSIPRMMGLAGGARPRRGRAHRPRAHQGRHQGHERQPRPGERDRPRDLARARGGRRHQAVLGGLCLGRARLPARGHAPGNRRRAPHRLPVPAGRRHRDRELPAGPRADGRGQGREHGQHDAGARARPR